MTKNSRTILLVDDSPEDRMIMRRFLQGDKNWSTTIIEADKGKDAIVLCHSKAPDCILLDLHLPDMTGLDILENLCEGRGYPLCPVVMVTGISNVDTAINALQKGAQDYLVKDRITPPELHRAITNAIEKADLRRALAEQQDALHAQNADLQRAVTARDAELEERRRVQNLLAAQQRVLESAALGAPLQDSLELIAWEFENLIPGSMFSISRKEGDYVHRLAAPSLPEPFRSAVDPLDMPTDLPAYSKLLKEGKAIIVEDIASSPLWNEYSVVARENQLFACWTVPFSAPRGEVLGIISAYFHETRVASQNDIEVLEMAGRLSGLVIEKVRAVQALHDSEEFNRLLLDSSPDCIKVMDIDGNLLAMNGAGLCSMEIDDFAPFEGKRWENLWPAEGRSKVQAAIGSAQSGRAGAFQSSCPTAKGTMKWWNVIVTPVRDGSQQIIGLLATARDISDERRAAEEREQLLDSEQAARAEAEQANRAKDDFIATLSHELRTPLAAIAGWSSLLRQGGLDEDTLQHGYEVIHRNAQAQNQIIEDILDISRIITGKMKIASQSLELHNVLEAACDAVHLAAENKNVHLTLEFSEHEGKRTNVQGDAARLQQVFWNLLNNAVKFTPSGGMVSIQVRYEDDWAIVGVQDSGQGIEPEFLPYVFERFRQADGSTTRKHSGLGLGLALVRYLVEAHGGSVNAHSEGTNRGAVFTVRLPLMKTSSSQDSAPLLATTQNLQEQNIIVVDDEDDVRELVEIILQRHGAQVRSASGALQALALVEENEPDVFITDIGMPDIDGIQLLSLLRERYDNRLPFRVIALTAYAGERNRHSILKAGFDAFLAKPVTPDALLEAVSGE